MSKQIDFSEPLSEEDAAYVAERPWLLKDAELSGFDVRGEEDFILDDPDAGSNPDGFQDPNGEDSEDDEDGSEGDADDESEDDEEDGDEVAPYSEWDYADLKEEAGNRNLSKAGSKEQLIQRLEESDAAAEAETE